MTDSYITGNEPEKKLQTYKNTIGGEEVHSEAVTPTDLNGIPFGQSNPQYLAATDGDIATIGAKNDTVASSDTDSASLISLFKRLLQKWTAGVNVQQNSLPVDSSNPLWIQGGTTIDEAAITALSTTTSTIGAQNVVTPASGKKIRLYWWGLSASPDNTATNIVSLRWTTTGTDFVKVPLSQYGGIFAHSYKGGRAYVEGAVDEALAINLSSAQSVTLNIDYEEAL